MTNDISRYIHGCPKCVLLGPLENFDVYWCPQHKPSTAAAVVWRWSDAHQMMMQVNVVTEVVKHHMFSPPVGVTVDPTAEVEIAAQYGGPSQQLEKTLSFALERMRDLGLETEPS